MWKGKVPLTLKVLHETTDASKELVFTIKLTLAASAENKVHTLSQTIASRLNFAYVGTKKCFLSFCMLKISAESHVYAEYEKRKYRPLTRGLKPWLDQSQTKENFTLPNLWFLRGKRADAPEYHTSWSPDQNDSSRFQPITIW